MSNSQVDKRSIETKVGTQKMCERETNFCVVGFNILADSPRGVGYEFSAKKLVNTDSKL